MQEDNELIRSLQKDAGFIDGAGSLLKSIFIDPAVGMYTNTRDAIGAASRGDLAGVGSNGLKLLGNTALTALNVGSMVVPGAGLVARVGAQAAGKLALGVIGKGVASAAVGSAEKASLGAAQKLVTGGLGRAKAFDDLFASSGALADSKHLAQSLAKQKAIANQAYLKQNPLPPRNFPWLKTPVHPPGTPPPPLPTARMLKTEKQLAEAQAKGAFAANSPKGLKIMDGDYSSSAYKALMQDKNLGFVPKTLLRAQKGLVSAQGKLVNGYSSANRFVGENLMLNRYLPVTGHGSPILPAIGAGIALPVAGDFMYGYSKPGQFDNLVSSPEFNSYYGKRRVGNLQRMEGDAMKANSLNALEQTGETDRFENWKSRVLG